MRSIIMEREIVADELLILHAVSNTLPLIVMRVLSSCIL